MNGRQRNLFERLVVFGFDRCESEFQVKFREVSARAFLKGFRRSRRRRCWEPGCGELVDAPRIYCDGHAFRRTLGFDPKTYDLERR